MDDEHEQEATETETIESDRARHPLAGRPCPRGGPRIARAGFSTFQELAEALGVTPECLSRVRHGREAMGASKRRRLAELLDVPEDEALSALRGDPAPRTPDLDAHRLSLLTALSARIGLLVEDEADDENELQALPGPMVPQETWTEVARDVGCTTRTLARIRRGVDAPTATMVERLSRALLVPPELALFALRRPWTDWRW